ncbi:MAG: T9SS type A sorting domain-containing protein, partial [Bacteroidota bacterium]
LIVEENAKYVEDKLVVTLSGAMELKPGKNKLGSICGRVLFPRELNNTVSFKEVSWYDPVTDMNVINGSLQISRESLCMPDLRHVGYFTPLNLSVQPNPSSETINLSIFSEPETPLTILLHDSQGRCLYSRSVTTTGKDNISIETTSLSNGLYHLQVKSPYEVKTIPVGVVK